MTAQTHTPRVTQDLIERLRVQSIWSTGLSPYMAAEAAAALTTATAEAEALRAEVERLRADKERLDWLQSEMNDVRWISGLGAEACSPSDEVGVRIISHWQAEPCERVEAENWSEDLRATIDEARAALERQP